VGLNYALAAAARRRIDSANSSGLGKCRKIFQAMKLMSDPRRGHGIQSDCRKPVVDEDVVLQLLWDAVNIRTKLKSAQDLSRGKVIRTVNKAAKWFTLEPWDAEASPIT